MSDRLADLALGRTLWRLGTCRRAGGGRLPCDGAAGDAATAAAATSEDPWFGLAPATSGSLLGTLASTSWACLSMTLVAICCA